jgi:hypothetical protein
MKLLKKTSIFRLFLFSAAKKPGKAHSDWLRGARNARSPASAMISFRRQLNELLKPLHASRRL